MRKDPVKTLVTPNYAKKTITIRPNKDKYLHVNKLKSIVRNKCKNWVKMIEWLLLD